MIDRDRALQPLAPWSAIISSFDGSGYPTALRENIPLEARIQRGGRIRHDDPNAPTGGTEHGGSLG
jgi:hypothetical protein